MKKFFLFSFFIIFSLILRIFISINIKPQGDVLIHQEWAEVLYHKGLSGSYFSQGWTYTPPTQPPLMMMSYFISHLIYENRNIFSLLHNYTKIPPASILIGFQKYGEILTLRIWEFIACIISGLIIYFHFSKKTSFKKSFIIFLLIIFNPITIFINSVWGQNDLLPTCFLYLSFLLLFSPFNILSPIIFSIGILFKPTIAIISPLFICIFLYILHKNNLKNKITKLILVVISIITLVYISFKPFIPLKMEPTNYIFNVVANRISTSSKGLKIASVSAFNLYSLIFNIDQTYATNDNFMIQLCDVGTIFYIILNIYFIFKLIRSKKVTFNHTLFSIYFISQGSFLFTTNMLERYFIPAFLSAVVITVIYWKRFGWLMVLQQIIWFINLIYAYYYRVNESINHLFRDNYFLLIRLFSLANIFIFIRLFQRYKKYFSINKKID